MRRVDLARQLVYAANETARRSLTASYPKLIDHKLAIEIKKICYNAWAVEPIKAQKAAEAIKFLDKVTKSPEISATALWVRGISEITKGKFASAASLLSKGAAILSDLGRPIDSAQAQVAQLLALAMSGRYDEAIATGQNALRIFSAAGDELAAGKIEMNLSNILSRQTLHRDAEKFCKSANRRFQKCGEKMWQAMAENGLANTYTELNEFSKAATFFQRALETARSQKMTVTEAEIEASLGNLALLRGKYSDALRLLESSRQKYEGLGIEHQSAIADLEIADIYSELSLHFEAVEIYSRLGPVFKKLKLRPEEARMRSNYARSLACLNEARTALNELGKALRLFTIEKNRSGQVAVLLARAELELQQSKFKAALATLNRALDLIRSDENPRHLITLRILEGTALRCTGDHMAAVDKLTDAVKLARKHQQPSSIQSALNELGTTYAAAGDTTKARRCFESSITVLENLRVSLSADEFSMSFLGSRLDSFNGLARILLSKRQVAGAFQIVERARSRSLLDDLEGRGKLTPIPKHLQEKERLIRAELDFFYKKLARSPEQQLVSIRSDIHRTEKTLGNVSRQIKSLVSVVPGSSDERGKQGIEHLQKELSSSRNLIEFIDLDGDLSAFVVNGKTINIVHGLGSISEVNEHLDDLHFQFGSMRYGDASMARFAEQIKARTNKVLRRLFDQLIAPLLPFIVGNELTIVPVGVLNFVPFHALYNGSDHLLERVLVDLAPSAAIWLKLRERKRKPIRRPMLMAYADETIPLVDSEVATLKDILPSGVSFTGEEATVAAFYENSAGKDLIHLACHGQFRPDNPMFSSLYLADGRITARDISSMRLSAGLVVLSACETGRNKIYAGDEVLGLARGFLSAGTSSIIVSLWNVNDAATSEMMRSLYANMIQGSSPGQALRQAQIDMIKTGAHPYLWAPFINIGG